MTHEAYTKHLFDNASTQLVSNSYKYLVDKDEFYTKLTGVTYGKRQNVISQLSSGEELFMEHDKENEYHESAIKLLTMNGEEVGFLPRELSDEMIKVMSDSNRLVFIHEITGEEDEPQGVNILIQKIHPLSDDELKVSKYPATMKRATVLQNIADELELSEVYKKRRKEINACLRGGNLSFYGNDEFEKNMSVVIASVYKILKQNQKILYLFNDDSSIMEYSRILRIISDKFNIRVREFQPVRDSGNLFASYIDGEEVHIIVSTYANLNKIHHDFGLIFHHHLDQNLKYLSVHEVSRLKARTSIFNHYNFNLMKEDEMLEVFGVKKFFDYQVKEGLDTVTLIDKRNIKDKDLFVFNFLYKKQKSVIFTNTRKKSVELARILRAKLPREMKHQVIFYHSGLPIEDKKIIEEKFRKDEYLFIVATTAFDITLHGDKLIQNIFIYNPPYSYNTFLNQIVQTSRFNNCKIHLIYSFYDVHASKGILSLNVFDKSDLTYVYKTLQYILYDLFKEKYGYFNCKNHELREKIETLTEKKYTNQQLDIILNTLDEMKVLSFDRRSNDLFIELHNVIHKADFTETQTYLKNLILVNMFVDFELLLLDNIQGIRDKLFE